MGFIWTSVVKDLMRLRRDPYALVAWISMPVLFSILMSAVFGGGSATPQGRLLVADEDGSFLSRGVMMAFGQEPLSKMVRVETTAAKDGREKMNRGEASAMLVIPKGFQTAYLRNQPFQLHLIKNPAQSIVPRIVEETLSITVDGLFYLQQVAGDQLRFFDTDRPPDEQSIARMSIEGNRLFTRLRRYLSPALIDLEREVVAEAPAPSFTSLFFPSMFYMALLFIANALAVDIWKEQMQGTLRRLHTTPSELWAYLAGRILFVVIVFVLVGIAGLGAMRFIAGVPVSNPAAALLWTVISGIAFYVPLLFASVHASSLRAASVLANVLIFPLALIGGCFFPFEMMPSGMAAIGRWTPNGMAIAQFRSIMNGSAQVSQALVFTGCFVALGAIMTPLLLRRMRGKFLS